MNKSTPKKEPEFKEEAKEVAVVAEAAVEKEGMVIGPPTPEEVREEALLLKAMPKGKSSKVTEAEDTEAVASSEAEENTVEEVKVVAEAIDNTIDPKLLEKVKKSLKVIKV